MIKLDMKRLRETLTDRMKEMVEKDGMKGEVVLFVQPPEDPRAASYVASKKKILEDIGLISVVACKKGKLSDDKDYTQRELMDILQVSLEEYIPTLIQLPYGNVNLGELPYWMSNEECDVTAGDIDVDRLFPESLASLSHGDSYNYMLPCTVNGIKHIINDYLFDDPWKPWSKNILYGQTVVVIGRGELVGRPLSRLLQDSGASVISLNAGSSKELIAKCCKMADIVISAVGVHGVIKSDYFNDDQRVLIVDAGVSFKDGKLYGDLEKPLFDDNESELMYKPRLTYTPHIGGVGPMTVLSVVENGLKLLFRKRMMEIPHLDVEKFKQKIEEMGYECL